MQRVRVLKTKRRKKIFSNRAWVLLFMAEIDCWRRKQRKREKKRESKEERMVCVWFEKLGEIQPQHHGLGFTQTLFFHGFSEKWNCLSLFERDKRETRRREEKLFSLSKLLSLSLSLSNSLFLSLTWRRRREEDEDILGFGIRW